MTHVTCRLTAKDRDYLRNPTLCNRVWATFTFNTNRLIVSFVLVSIQRYDSERPAKNMSKLMLA